MKEAQTMTMTNNNNNSPGFFTYFIIILIAIFFGAKFGHAEDLSTISKEETKSMTSTIPSDSASPEKSVIYYDTNSKEYILMQFGSEFTYDKTTNTFSQSSVSPYYDINYYWDGQYWIPETTRTETTFTLSSNQMITYSGSNLKNADGEIEFYKTDVMIANPLLNGMNTELLQGVFKYIKIVLPFAIGILGIFVLFFYVIPKTFKKLAR